jgi:hypothetical protein
MRSGEAEATSKSATVNSATRNSEIKPREDRNSPRKASRPSDSSEEKLARRTTRIESSRMRSNPWGPGEAAVSCGERNAARARKSSFFWRSSTAQRAKWLSISRPYFSLG